MTPDSLRSHNCVAVTPSTRPVITIAPESIIPGYVEVPVYVRRLFLQAAVPRWSDLHEPTESTVYHLGASLVSINTDMNLLYTCKM